MVMGASVSACGTTEERWNEEVQLSDGRVIVVERRIIMERGGDEWAYNRAGVKPKEYLIRFSALDGSGQTIEWKSVKNSPHRWPEIALILDVDAGQPVVFTSVYLESGCEVYLKYRHQGSAWTEQPLPDRFEQRTTNLLIRSGVGMPKFVSLQDKRVSNKDVGYRPSLKRVGPDRTVCG
jgi:hypothetical protein